MSAALGTPWSLYGILSWVGIALLLGVNEYVGYRRVGDSWPTLTNLVKWLLPQPGRDGFFTRVTDWLKAHFHSPGGTR